MANFDVQFAEAERLRINGNRSNDFRKATRLYQGYIRLGGPMVVLANQMTGVCYQRLHEYGTATEFYLLAMEEASDYERGNIERDLAESYGALGEYELAESSLAKSLDLLPYAKYPEEHAQSLGHLARLQLRQGQIAEAVDTFADAAAKLKAGHYLQAELYPELDYASALSRDGQLAKARLVAFHSLKLSLSKNPQTGRPYGSRQHHMRALALITGGHSLEDYLKKRKVR